MPLFLTLAFAPTHHLWYDSAGKLWCAGIMIFECWLLVCNWNTGMLSHSPHCSSGSCAADARAVLPSDISHAAGRWQADKFSLLFVLSLLQQNCCSHLWHCVSCMCLYIQHVSVTDSVVSFHYCKFDVPYVMLYIGVFWISKMLNLAWLSSSSAYLLLRKSTVSNCLNVSAMPVTISPLHFTHCS